MKFISLEHVAQQFASKEKSVTLIFNHSSTQPLTINQFRKINQKEEIQGEQDIDSMFSFYEKEEEKKEEIKDKFGLEFADIIPKGVAVLVNMNLGKNDHKSVKNEAELLRHIKLIDESIKNQHY
jgi:hypothetical protein